MHQKILENYLAYCIYLAKLGKGTVSPNPPVGSILVYGDNIIGEAYHQKFGGAHAEVLAINSVPANCRHLIAESTLFVTLEPCNHYGKTGPCTKYILDHNIRKLVFGAYDPNPKMSGSSISYLRSQGVEVVGPVLEKQSTELIKEFRINVLYNRPYIILKFAQTGDFFTGVKNKTLKISNPCSDLLVHKWRSESDGILVGSNTVKTDNPFLTTRLWPGKNPIRIALGRYTDSNKKLLNIFNSDAVTLDLNSLNQDPDVDLSGMLTQLFQQGIGILIVEGGFKTIQSFHSSGIWDEARIITNSTLRIKDGIPAPSIQGLLSKKIILDKDVIHFIANPKPLS